MERIKLKVHAGEDESEVGQFCAGRSVREGEVDILHKHNVRSEGGVKQGRANEAYQSNTCREERPG